MSSRPIASTSRSAPRELSVVAVENAQQRLQRLHSLSKLYSHGRTPARPKSKTELDVLKEHHQFIRHSDSSEPLSWEDALADKYYRSLFREFALVDLKHYKSGAIALRWRTEDEVVQGIGNLTCGSLRCEYHQPVVDDFAPEMPDIEGETEQPLVPTRLAEQEMHFGYIEEGEKKSALVKVVLCDRCSRKLRRGREKAKKDREERETGRKIEPENEEARQSRRRRERDATNSEDNCRPHPAPDRSASRRRSTGGHRNRADRRRSASPPASRSRDQHF